MHFFIQYSRDIYVIDVRNGLYGMQHSAMIAAIIIVLNVKMPLDLLLLLFKVHIVDNPLRH